MKFSRQAEAGLPESDEKRHEEERNGEDDEMAARVLPGPARAVERDLARADRKEATRSLLHIVSRILADATSVLRWAAAPSFSRCPFSFTSRIFVLTIITCQLFYSDSPFGLIFFTREFSS